MSPLNAPQDRVEQPASCDRMKQVCADVAADMARDAREFDGKPFNGRTVAEYLGNQGAAIAALANILSELLKQKPVSHE